ncbi:hypothetical protein Agabi119p4_8613 [Agaricus bisporus var. burnettii]|uniref:Uncharacterized protein n=1 Tax=Agaricus bisporus var. burnettii TaxID=192524 RepID=A0A8H7C6D4_AGABI|nr:hypothetical protein Agabi119p4_8613 [Agaricus bisporus var. burnettii]
MNHYRPIVWVPIGSRVGTVLHPIQYEACLGMKGKCSNSDTVERGVDDEYMYPENICGLLPFDDMTSIFRYQAFPFGKTPVGVLLQVCRKRM